MEMWGFKPGILVILIKAELGIFVTIASLYYSVFFFLKISSILKNVCAHPKLHKGQGDWHLRRDFKLDTERSPKFQEVYKTRKGETKIPPIWQ